MPHYKCEACKARLYVSGSAAELVGDLCPECGSLLEPVTELADLVGYRSVTARAGGAAAPRSERHRRAADLIGESIARQASKAERDRLDAACGLGDHDEPAAVAVALPPPRTYL